jgi:hypothetical protein
VTSAQNVTLSASAGGVVKTYGITLSISDTTPPTVSITAPAANATLTGTVTLAANASDNVAVAKVQFKVDNTNVGPAITSTPYSYSLDTTTLSNGSHTLTAVATDTSGNSATSAAVVVTVSNSVAPNISGLNPSSGSPGTAVVITGSNFGASQGTSTVRFNGTTGTPASWSDTSITVPVPTAATSGNVVVTVNGTASNGVAFTVTTVKFPIKASANGRYFTDSNGVAWIMMADAGHHIVPAIPQSSWAAYLADRVKDGFNTVDLYAMCAGGGGTCPNSGAAYDGTLPFTTGTDPTTYDLSTPNSAYWSKVDTLVSDAAADGLVVMLNPIPWGNNFGSTLQNNGATKDYNFGVFIGNRYKGYSNIVWQIGEDFDLSNLPSSSNVNLVAQVMAGIKAADPNHIMSVELNYNRSYSTQASSLNATYAANLTYDFVYDYYETYDYVLAAYNSTPALPVFMGEANYETANNTGALSGSTNAFITRMQSWWTMTSGGAGFEFGNEHVNHFDSSYQTNLDTTATLQQKYILQLFDQYPWWTFAPDQTHAVVTAGYGSYNGNNENLFTATYATTTWDGSSTSITYTPVATTLKVNLGVFSKPVSAYWYDPTTGSSTPISGSPFPNGGSQNFTTPSTAHSDGTNDWILVLH